MSHSYEPRTIILLDYTSEIVINKLISMGFTVSTTDDIRQIYLDPIKTYDFSSIVSEDEYELFYQCGLIPHHKKKKTVVIGCESTNLWEAAIKELKNERDLYPRKEDSWISNKDRFHDKRKWRK